MNIYEATMLIDLPDYNVPCIVDGKIEFRYVDESHRKITRHTFLVQANNLDEARQKVKDKIVLSQDSSIFDIQFKLLKDTFIL